LAALPRLTALTFTLVGPAGHEVPCGPYGRVGAAVVWRLSNSRTAVRVMMGEEAIDPWWVPEVGGTRGIVAGESS